jgi:chromate reductase
MPDKLKILAISGSTSANSSNLNLIKAIIAMTGETLDIRIFQNLSAIPHFNPDLDREDPPKQVIDLRKQLDEADGVLISTPEYAMGVPGTLKNAIDWTVSSSNFYHKPVALITASSLGEKGHRSLLETLHIIEAEIPENSQLLISMIKMKVSSEGITDIATEEKVSVLLESFVTTIRQKNQISHNQITPHVD